MQRLRVPAVVLGATLLVAGIGAGLSISPLAQDRDRALSAALDHGSATTDDYFHRASSVVLLAAQTPDFAEVYSDVPAGRSLTRAQIPPVKLDAAYNALVRIERLFHGQVDRACFIDLSGNELSCVANGVATAAKALVQRPAADMHAVATTVPVNTVYAGHPTVSRRTNDRVVAMSTLVADGAGMPRAVVEFEVTLSGLADSLAATTPQTPIQVVDALNGSVVLDSTPLATTQRSDQHASRRYAVARWQDRGQLTAGDRAVRYSKMARYTPTGVNSNAWYVVASTPQLPPGWRASVDVGPVVLVVLGIALLALSAAWFVQHGRYLVKLSLLDELTGLPNRPALYERLGRGLAENDAQAVMIVDLDRFKTVNDTLGHFAGDILLAEVGRRFAALCPPGDLVARLGGDEFSYVMAPVPGVTVLDRARQLVHALETPILVEGNPVQVGCSVGIALLGEHGDDVTTLIRRADLAMYEAKRRRTGVTMFEAGLERRSSAGLTFETSLLHALERHELVLHYQPQIDIGSGEVYGVEALVRWQHPELGLLGPDRFIPLAEETGLIVGLTKHVLAMALDQVLAWSLAGHDIPVAVNLAARNVADPRLPTDVAQMLSERHLPSRLLRLELTETDLLGDPEQARAVLQELTVLGVELAVDDFGTGFASLSQLRKLPFRELKIDRSFVAVLEGDAEAVHIVDSVVDLAHGLGLTVTAEGVETVGCLDVLRSVGCDVAQGYLFSKPLPADAALAWIQHHDPLTVARQQPSSLPVIAARRPS